MGIYIDALKIYNSNSKDGTKWITPRKNTTDYNAVIKIMEDLKKNTPKKEPKAKAPKKETKTKTKAPKKSKVDIMKPKTDSTMHG
jgi:dTDP-4-dehydrorhamnose reductase